LADLARRADDEPDDDDDAALTELTFDIGVVMVLLLVLP
jgi:hypothetical protein